MNTIHGIITQITVHDSLRLVDVASGGVRVRVMTLELDERFVVGSKVAVLVKESDISLAKGALGMVSIENSYPGGVVGITAGKVFSEVVLYTPVGALVALIPRSAQDAMLLAVDDAVTVLIRSNEIAMTDAN